MNTNYAKRVNNAKKISSKYESKLKWGVKNYNPIPGPFLHGLNNTKELFKNYNLESLVRDSNLGLSFLCPHRVNK